MATRSSSSKWTSSSPGAPARAKAGRKTGKKVVSKGKASTGTARGREALSKEERRAQILVAARTVFLRVGYARATVDDIVRQAGVARGTYYLYFDDKRAALAELIDSFAAKIGHSIIRIVTDQANLSVSEQVLQNIRGIVGVCLEERALTKILFTDAVGADLEFQRKLHTFYDGVVQLLTESLRDGQALGVVADGEPRVLAYLTIGALKELLYQAVTLGLSSESSDALTSQIYDFLSQGYLRAESQP